MTAPSYLLFPRHGGTPIALADRAALDAWMATRGLTVAAVKQSRSTRLRPEIEGQPIVGGLLGPVYGGPGVCRYEISAAVPL